ncbi:MAG TPA: LysM peptidoglycan-binding domain-containing protein, partial [Opitutaceae bacterium]
VTPVTTYTVAKGDTLSTIARKNKLSKADLASANNLKSGSILHQGQKLILPSKQAPAAPSVPVAAQARAAEPAPAEKVATESTKHVVKPGETLGGIARKYGVKQGEIAVANNITDPRKIQPGQELVIPARSTSTTGKAPRAAKPSAADTADAPSKAQAPAAADQDLDAGLKPTGASDVPVVKIEDTSSAQPKNP